MADGTKTCGVEGCTADVIARGWCRRHYYQWHRAQQDPEVLRRRWRESYHRHSEKTLAKRRALKPARQERPCVDCGTAIHRVHVRGDIPQRCDACRVAHEKAQARARGPKRRSCVTRTTCWTCGEMFDLPTTRKRGKIAGYCPECRKLRNRQRRAERRAKERTGDVTDAVLLALAKKRCCAMCRIVMTRGVGPKQRQIDHIVPLNVGGSHTPANLRAICRTCNYKRPKDGSDLSQMPLLPFEMT